MELLRQFCLSSSKAISDTLFLTNNLSIVILVTKERKKKWSWENPLTQKPLFKTKLTNNTERKVLDCNCMQKINWSHKKIIGYHCRLPIWINRSENWHHSWSTKLHVYHGCIPESVEQYSSRKTEPSIQPQKKQEARWSIINWEAKKGQSRKIGSSSY